LAEPVQVAVAVEFAVVVQLVVPVPEPRLAVDFQPVVLLLSFLLYRPTWKWRLP
jgi:hypothetical protein